MEDENKTVSVTPTELVAFIEGNEDVKYSSLKHAISVAQAGNNKTVVIMPGTILDIKSNLVIPSGVKLLIPYAEYDANGNYTGYNYVADKNRVAALGTNYSDRDAANEKKFRSSLINLKNGADITIESGGSLYLGGEIKGKGITGYYSEINLSSNSKIEVKGEFYCYGYVKEESSSAKNSGQEDYLDNYTNDFDGERLIKVHSGGKLETALGIYDSKDSVLVNYVTGDEKVFPFSLFDFPCMQTYIEVNYGATMNGMISLAIGSADISIQSATVVAKKDSGSSIFYLSSGKICFEYCPQKDVRYTSTGITRIFIDGDIEQGYIDITPEIKGIPYNINTQEMFIPISYKFNILINSGGSYKTDYQMKFLPGAIAMISSGAEFIVNSEVAFYKSSFSKYIDKYDTTQPDAKLINNGKITIGTNGAIGAIISTTSNDGEAIIDFTNCTTDRLSVISYEYSTSIINVNTTSEGYFADEDSVEGKSLYQFVAGTTVKSSLSENNCWDGEKYKVYKLDIIVSKPYTANALSYRVYIADDSNGTNSVDKSGAVLSDSSNYNVVLGQYYQVAVSRHESATFTDGTEINPTQWYRMTSDVGINIVANEAVKISFSSTSISGAGNIKYKIYEGPSSSSVNTELGEFEHSGSVYVIKDYWFKVTHVSGTGTGTSGTLSVTDITVKDSKGTVLSTISAGSAYQATANLTLVINLKSCLLPDTLITMSDGSKVPVKNIKPGDMLKVFNHETGNYDEAPVLFNDYEAASEVTVINLEFSNGSYIGVVSEHGFFDLDLMKYVYVNEFNYNDYVGHEFYADNGEIVTLNKAYITREYTEVYSPVTRYHLNYFTEDILSMPGGIEGLFNIFEYDDNLQYNQELMQKDIEMYGLFTYDDFKDLVPFELYDSFATQYFKVAIGKGILTWEQLYYYIERYGPLVE